jgi:CheY-like chemotaxis protein
MKKILLVDDSPTVVSAAYDELEERGYVVDVAYNGKECLQRLEQSPEELPRLIVMDIEMPKMRGDEAAKLIKQDPRWAHIPIVALTARAPDAIGEFLAFFDNYLVKPFGFNELLDLVQRMIGAPE